MDKQKKMVVFAEDWGRFPSSTQSLVSSLLKQGWQVTWINSVGMRQPGFGLSYLSRVAGKISRLFRNKSAKGTVPQNLTIINPLIFPLIGHSFFDKFNNYILKKQLQRAQPAGFEDDIIWVTLPTAWPFLKLFKKSPVVYYCCDDYEGLGDDLNPKIPYFEQQLIEASTLICYVSDILGKKFPDSKKMFLDHGVDVGLFTKKYPRPGDLPAGKPVAGFYGSITPWVDLELLYQCATQLKTWNFVLIGPTSVSLQKLEQLDNVFYLGAKPYESIPAYSQYWDVGMIPFVINDLIKACNPLKIKEYLLTGNPVVTTDIPALHVFGKHIFIAKNRQDFIKGIEQSLQDKTSHARMELVNHAGWDDRARMVEEKLLQMTRRKA